MPDVPVDYFPGALGYALPDAEVGVNAMIFFDRIERFRKSGEVDLPTLLGHAMAHEIGHALLAYAKCDGRQQASSRKELRCADSRSS